MSKRQWHQTISGVSLQKIRKREELTRQQAAKALSTLLRRDVSTRDIDTWEQGQEPSQVALGALMEAYHMGDDDYAALYPITEAEEARRQDRDQRKTEIESRQRAVDRDGWQPVQFRGAQIEKADDDWADSTRQQREEEAARRRQPGGAL
jgi:hypothetical protein